MSRKRVGRQWPVSLPAPETRLDSRLRGNVGLGLHWESAEERSPAVHVVLPLFAYGAVSSINQEAPRLQASPGTIQSSRPKSYLESSVTRIPRRPPRLGDSPREERGTDQRRVKRRIVAGSHCSGSSLVGGHGWESASACHTAFTLNAIIGCRPD